jgi:hypothetical protein
MTQIAPIDPGMRKIVLPSIIRISDSLAGIILSRLANRGMEIQHRKENSPGYAFRFTTKQLKLEFE